MKARWLVGLVLVIVISNGQFFYGQLLSLEAAKNAVMRFEKKTVTISVSRLIEVNGKKFYHLSTPTGDEYRVDAQTGEVVGVIYWSIPLPDAPQDHPPSDAMPLSKLRSIAQTIAGQRYPQFRVKKMVLHEPFWDGYTFAFQFQEQLPNGALTGNLCIVRLLPDGRLYSYQAQQIAVEQEAMQKPKISPQQAVEIARKAAKLLEVTNLESQKLVYRDKRLLWVLRMFGPSLKGFYSGCVVLLDAHSGKIVEVAPFRLIGHPFPPRGHTMIVSELRGVLLKREFAPIRHNGLWVIRAEIVKAFGGKVLRQGKQIYLEGDKLVRAKNCWQIRGVLCVSLKDLRDAFPRTIEAIKVDQTRNTVLICVEPSKFGPIQQNLSSMHFGANIKDLEREFGLISASGEGNYRGLLIFGIIAGIVFSFVLVAFRMFRCRAKSAQ